jgi:uncharacterized protein
MRSRVLARRLLLLLGVVAAVYLLGFGGYGFAVGANEYLSGEPRGTGCATPESQLGWAYEAINYDIADDAALLAANPDPAHCATQGSEPGTDVVAPDGVRLAGWFIPAARARPGATGHPTLVLIHGGKTNKSGMLDYAPPLHDAYDLVIVDLRNSGRSGQAFSTGGLREQGDLRAMLDWLERTKHPSWIGLVGNSNGAATAVAEAAGDPRVQALVLDSMHASVERQIGNVIVNEKHLPAWPGAFALIAGVNARLGEDVGAVDPERALPLLHGRPILFTHGLADVVDRPSDSLEINVAVARAAGIELEVHTCPGAGHGQVVFVCAADWATWVLTFLAAQGGAGSGASAAAAGRIGG